MDPRTLEQLEAITRERLDDVALSKPRWSQALIWGALNEAQREAALRGRLLRDDTSAKTLIAVVADTPVYLLDPAFFEVIELRDALTGAPLDPIDAATLGSYDDRWRTRTSDCSDQYIVECLPSERLRLRLVGIPNLDRSLQLDGYRLPLAEMEDARDEPELAPRHHEALVDWAMYRCFNVRDSDNYDPKKASDHLAEFVRNFGQRPDANVHRKQRESARHVVRARDF